MVSQSFPKYPKVSKKNNGFPNIPMFWKSDWLGRLPGLAGLANELAWLAGLVGWLAAWLAGLAPWLRPRGRLGGQVCDCFKKAWDSQGVNG